MSRVLAVLFAVALLPTLSLSADSFSLSHAPVHNDPTLTHRPTAKLWPHINIAEARRLLGHDDVVFI
ncbi:MAG: hypothetical protein ACREKE_09130, partial [bacterium]